MYSNWKVDGTVPPYWIIFGPFDNLPFGIGKPSILGYPNSTDNFASANSCHSLKLQVVQESMSWDNIIFIHTVDGWNPKQPPNMYETL